MSEVIGVVVFLAGAGWLGFKWVRASRRGRTPHRWALRGIVALGVWVVRGFQKEGTR